ncbi:MAG: hypothetical protein HY721_00425, partial [Planctomycetes bacterium]|nr:hypothetical protein [Planctomycetota bacterium]
MKAGRSHRIPVLVLGAAASALGAAAGAWALQAPGHTTTYRPAPQRKGRPAKVARGEVLLAIFLQQLADSTGETVYFKGAEGPDFEIRLPRDIEALEAKTAAEILEDQGFELSETDYRGKKVLWVQKLIVPARQKGRIVRPGEKPEPPGAAPSPPGP